MKQVVVIGGGAAGLMAAVRSASLGNSVMLLEKNEKCGKKLFITGKGRCNLTNACDISDLFTNVISNPKFLYSAFYSFTNEHVIDFFEELGVKTKIERGNRVFPASDKSSDVIRALERACRRQGVTVCLNTRVRDLQIRQKRVTGVILADGRQIPADKVILATGGCSYPGTGATKEGYRLAQAAGHTVTPLRPGLTGIVSGDPVGKNLQGLTLKNIRVSITRIKAGKKPLYEGFGELLFTHYGVSGPLMLSASSLLGDMLAGEELILHIDLKPALAREQFDKRMVKEFAGMMNNSLKNACRPFLPKSMIGEVLRKAELDPDSRVHQLNKEKRLKLVDRIKDFTITLKGLRDLDEAIITRGGVQVSEVDPSTMKSRCTDGLYLAGEMLDLDALTGGFNLQIAWSTGYLAGSELEEVGARKACENGGDYEYCD